MKRRQIAQPDRRRPLVELNLTGETRSRSTARAKGCASLLTRVLADAALLLLVVLGLS